MNKRKYNKSQRAAGQEQTRARIVEAAMRLHEERGPAHTSIKAVAEEAGVQRLTVYRYFPDDARLFQACTSHWLELNPPPNISKWQDIHNPGKRTYTALLAFYRYYRRTEKMWNASYRDLDKVAALQEPMAKIETYLDGVSDDLVNAWEQTRNAKKQLRITLRHGLRFSTWQSLKGSKLTDEKLAKLVGTWLTGITG